MNITNKELATRIGVSEVTCCNLINNKTTPSLITLKKISEVLGVSISQLLGEPCSTQDTSNDFAAFVRCHGRNYTPGTLDELHDIVERLRTEH